MPPKPRSSPESRDPPRIRTRRRETSQGGGVLAIASRDARVVEDAIRFSKSPGISPDFGSKPTIFRTGKSTLIPRGTHGYRETRDKPRTPLPQENKPEMGFRQKEDLENKFVYLLADPSMRMRSSPDA